MTWWTVELISSEKNIPIERRRTNWMALQSNEKKRKMRNMRLVCAINSNVWKSSKYFHSNWCGERIRCVFVCVHCSQCSVLRLKLFGCRFSSTVYIVSVASIFSFNHHTISAPHRNYAYILTKATTTFRLAANVRRAQHRCSCDCSISFDCVWF